MWGIVNDKMQYVAELDIACYQTDVNMRLRPAAFMDLAQEMAYQAAETMGFGYECLRADGKAWVLSRIHFHFDKAPYWRDRVKMATWHKGPSGPFFIREFQMWSPGGETLVRGTSSWIAIDTENRCMARPAEIELMVPGATVCPIHAIEEHAPKVIMPRSLEPESIGEHKVNYTDVDLLGHTNNVRYMVWAMDSIPYNVLKANKVGDVQINFSHETTAGQSVAISRCVQDGVYFVEGNVEGKNAFIVRIEFR